MEKEQIVECLRESAAVKQYERVSVDFRREISPKGTAESIMMLSQHLGEPLRVLTVESKNEGHGEVWKFLMFLVKGTDIQVFKDAGDVSSRPHIIHWRIGQSSSGCFVVPYREKMDFNVLIEKSRRLCFYCRDTRESVSLAVNVCTHCGIPVCGGKKCYTQYQKCGYCRYNATGLSSSIRNQDLDGSRSPRFSTPRRRGQRKKQTHLIDR